jgi:hypothetical protein
MKRMIVICAAIGSAARIINLLGQKSKTAKYYRSYKILSTSKETVQNEKDTRIYKILRPIFSCSGGDNAEYVYRL